MQSQTVCTCLEPHFTNFLPLPVLSFSAQYLRNDFSINRQRKATWPRLFAPRSSPIVCPYIYIVETTFFHVYSCRSIIHRFTHSMCQQIRRAHLVHKLLINNPTSLLVEALCFHQNFRSLHHKGTQERNYRYEEFLAHIYFFII